MKIQRKSHETLRNLNVKNKLLPFKEATLSKQMALVKKNARMENQAAVNVLSSSEAREMHREIDEEKSPGCKSANSFL